MFHDILDIVLSAKWTKEEKPLLLKQILRNSRWSFTNDPPILYGGLYVSSSVWDEVLQGRKYFLILEHCSISDLTPN